MPFFRDFAISLANFIGCISYCTSCFFNWQHHKTLVFQLISLSSFDVFHLGLQRLFPAFLMCTKPRNFISFLLRKSIVDAVIHSFPVSIQSQTIDNTKTVKIDKIKQSIEDWFDVVISSSMQHEKAEKMKVKYEYVHKKITSLVLQ